jgi:hypothetical protein
MNQVHMPLVNVTAKKKTLQIKLVVAFSWIYNFATMNAIQSTTPF